MNRMNYCGEYNDHVCYLDSEHNNEARKIRLELEQMFLPIGLIQFYGDLKYTAIVSFWH